jgi:hypothetical protein
LMVDPKGDAEIIQAQKMMKDTLEEWIPKILAAQEPDGYLQTAFTLSNRQRWTDRYRGDHEGYVAGYYLEAAVSHYMLTGGKDLRLYNSAKKLADCWEANIGPAPGKQEWFDGHQGMEMALVRFGRFVNNVEGGVNWPSSSSTVARAAANTISRMFLSSVSTKRSVTPYGPRIIMPPCRMWPWKPTIMIIKVLS